MFRLDELVVLALHDCYRHADPGEVVRGVIGLGLLHRSEVLDELRESGRGKPQAVAVSAMMPSVAAVDASGRPIAHKQVHIFTIADGQISRHRAVRDDLGLLLQLGWRPGN